ncbi:PAS domain-containing protein [Azospirillum doebereinerae]|uniref:PAS domain-containing protein n=1 Tax=Azospirillum doebereinerae TaxID=92933 RepID=UPI00384B1A84
MRLKTLPPARLILAAALTLGPLLAALVLAVRSGALSGPLAFCGAVLGLAGAALAVRTYHRDAAAVAHYVARLAEDGDPSSTAGTPAALGGLVASIARLHRSAAWRTGRVQAQLDTNESILDALPAPLLLMDAERQVTRVNAAGRGLFGDKVLGRDLASTLRNPNVLEAVDSVLRGGASPHHRVHAAGSGRAHLRSAGEALPAHPARPGSGPESGSRYAGRGKPRPWPRSSPAWRS